MYSSTDYLSKTNKSMTDTYRHLLNRPIDSHLLYDITCFSKKSFPAFQEYGNSTPYSSQLKSDNQYSKQSEFNNFTGGYRSKAGLGHP